MITIKLQTIHQTVLEDKSNDFNRLDNIFSSNMYNLWYLYAQLYTTITITNTV